MIFLFTIALGALFVPLLVYPALLWIRSLSSQKTGSVVEPSESFPTVDLIVCAFNEEAGIAAKIENIFELDYPQDRLRVWIASDGSTDTTVELVRSFDDTRIKLLDLPRQGKAAALTAAVNCGDGSILAFSDANSIWRHDALKSMTRHFADKNIGGVAGNQVYVGAQSAESSGERGYWALDRLLKIWQSAAANVTSATGAIYCIRRTLFQSPPADATDDFMISTGVIEQGYRLVFEHAAVAEEEAANSVTGTEFDRKVRITTRGLRGVYYRRSLLNPFQFGLYAVQLAVHKLWRRLLWIPFLALLVLAPIELSLAVTQSSVGPFALLSLLLLVSAILALVGAVLPAARSVRLVTLAMYIYVVNIACAIAFANFLTGRTYARWNNLRASSDVESIDVGSG